MLEPLSKSQIRNIMRAEQKSSGITRINPGLYRSLSEYLERLKEAYLQAHRENHTQKALTLTKDIRDTERDISTIYELRERKILLMAQDTVRGGAPSLKHLFPEEKLLLLRLSSILLAQRREIGIDFDPKVDRFLRTVAREYDLERTFLAPFNPLDPLCRDDPVMAGAIGEVKVAERKEGIPAETMRSADGNDISPTTPAGDRGHETFGNDPEPEPVPGAAVGSRSVMDPSGMRGIEVRKDIAVDEMIERIGAPDREHTDFDAPGWDPESGSGGSLDHGNLASGGTGGKHDVPVRGKPLMPDEHDTPGNAGETMKSEREDGDGDNGMVVDGDGEGTDFLKEYVITGTLDATPQFRGNDLHNYRFEPGEIISLPVKMGELLERQGKLFIVNIGRNLKTPRGEGS